MNPDNRNLAPDGAVTRSPHVEFDGVNKSYDGATFVVRDMRLEVRDGEFVTLLGPSGSGKTTSLMMLAGFTRPTSGSIRIRGRPVQATPPHRRGIGMVFQNYALFPHMTVRQNLTFPLEVRGVGRSRQEARLADILRLSRLHGLADRRPSELSGGQQQRVAIARALIFEPELVLMDEPLGALDRRLREEMQYEIRRIHHDLGITVVYVTHDQQEAMVLSDRVAVFRDGRIEQTAPPAMLYEEPERSFVARFIGENNRLDGVVRSVRDGLCEVKIGGGSIRALVVAPLEVGARTTVSIRPERIAISPAEGLYSNQIDARVEDLTFLGDHIRVRLRLLGTSDFIVKIPSTAGFGGILPGDDVRLGWAATDCRALDHDAEDSA